MEINRSVLNQVQAAGAQLVVVTKYWDATQTQLIIGQLKTENCVLGWGENRTTALATKYLPREETHFIGRLQSRQLPAIVQHCAVVHSLANVKHAQKLDQLVSHQNVKPLKVFVQVNVGGDPAKEGLMPETLPQYLKALGPLKNLSVLGLSTMGWAEVETKEEIRKKKEEFSQLITLRDQFLPQGLTSAGTSRDYHLALEAGIDIVRVGQGVVV